ncbi:MAG TPA: ABC transporter permease [Puia sp.]|nr:ABC transporter permease [Puia sp.]
MLKNYFRVALRHLLRNKFAGAINIGGLAIGMAVAILIGLWIYDEVTFDHATPNHSRIAAVLKNEDFNGIQTWWSLPWEIGPALRKDYGSLFKYVIMDAGNQSHLLTYGDKKIKPTGDYAEPPIIDMLSLRMLHGNKTALDDQSSVILSATTARELFGDADPMGKVIMLDNAHPVKVTGIYADLPGNSSFNYMQFMVPWRLLINSENYETTLGWGNSWLQCYVQLNDHIDMDKASQAIAMTQKRYDPYAAKGSVPTLFLHPLDRWHLYSEFKDGVSVGGAIRFVRLYGIIGGFILLLACINFMNLSTARSEKRAREVGIRKAIGSLRGQLIRQFFSESMLIALVAFVLAIGIAQLLLPFFSEVADKKMDIPWGRPLFWLAGFGFAAFTGLLAGSYPALYLSSFRPIAVLKGSFKAGPLAAIPRKVLVVVQFSVSVMLIVGTIAVLHQIQYAKDRPVGFNREALVTIPLQTFKPGNQFGTLRRELLATGVVEDIAGSESSAVSTYITNNGFTWPGKDPTIKDQFVTNGITPEFGKVIGWHIKAGRDFSPQYGVDAHSLLINETAVRYMGLKDPVGTVLKWGDNGLYTIIGVVGDMVAQSPYSTTSQMIFFLNSYTTFSHISLIDVRLKPSAAMAPALAAIGNVFKKLDPQDPFEYHFVDEEYAHKFDDEQRIAELAGFFTVLAIFISCLGLLGLSAFVAEQRTREIGIRKVLGASVFGLWNLLSKEFIGLVGLALLIGSPIAFVLMHSWLDGYEYHAGLSWWIFAITALGAIGITLLTVSIQAVRAALANPVKSLRSE